MAKRNTKMSLKDYVELVKSDLKNAKADLFINDDSFVGVPTTVDIYNVISGGGVPLRKHVLLTGAPGGGKSTLAIAFGAALHNSNPESMVYYIDVEDGMMIKRAIALGLDPDRFVHIAGVITLEKMLPLFKRISILKQINGRMDIPDMFIWDSETYTVTETAISEEDGKVSKQPAQKAKQLRAMYPRMTHLAIKYNNTFITISQLINNIKINPYAADMTSLKGLGDKTITGGEMAKYAPFQILNVRPKGSVDSAIWGFPGIFTEVSFVKNRLAPPLAKFEICLDYLTGYSDFWTKFNLLKEYGFIKGEKFSQWSDGKKKEKEKRTKKGKEVLEEVIDNSMDLDAVKEEKFLTKDAKKLYETDESFKTKFDSIYLKCKEKKLMECSFIEESIQDESSESEGGLPSEENEIDPDTKMMESVLTDLESSGLELKINDDDDIPDLSEV